MTLDFALIILASAVVTAAGVAFHFHYSRKTELEEKLKPVDKIRQYALELQLKYGSSSSAAPSDAELQATDAAYHGRATAFLPR